MSDEIKLCRDCEHRRLSILGSTFWACKSPKNLKRPNPVSGKAEVGITYCSTHRGSQAAAPYDCGSEGRFFEPRKPLLEKVVRWIGGVL